MERCQTPCEGCALTPGAAANLEPNNYLKALICVLGPVPFWCHDGQDWANPDNHKPMTAADFRERGFRVCAGWKREVARLAATGYYKENPEVTKAIAMLASGQLETLLGSDNAEDKEEAAGMLEAMMKRLGDKRQKFQGKETLV